MLFRTLAWRPAQLSVEPIARIEVDEGADLRLAAAIRLPTVSRVPTPDADFSTFDDFHSQLETSFPHVFERLSRERVGGQSLLFTWPGEDSSAKPSLLLAHIDVVPVEPGTESAWTHGPFSGDIDQEFIWGRGTLDDKVGVIAILAAVETLLKVGFTPKRTVLLAFGHDEEIGGQAGAARIAALLKGPRNPPEICAR
jgi:carboxypeptidase PM20D1